MFNVCPSQPQLFPGARAGIRRRTKRAFTLVEVMIATAVFTMGILGVYAMMIKSYELVTLARHRDNARAFLQSFSDEFLRLQTTDLIGGVPVLRPLFATTGTGGDGLTWTNPAGVQVNGSTLPYLTVTLGDSTSSQIPAQVSRQVWYLTSTGATSTTQTTTAAGWMLQATFTIQYQVNGRTQRQDLTVARSVR
jgi:prepilin-type N-terminal cleavage/methylation domain-containing protein